MSLPAIRRDGRSYLAMDAGVACAANRRITTSSRKLGGGCECYRGRMGGRHQKNAEAKGFTGRQQRALTLLAAGGLKKDAAREVGVHPQAVSEWMRQPHFRAALDSMRAQLVRCAMDHLSNMTVASLGAIHDVLHHGSPALRLRAAMYTLDRVLQMEGAQALSSASAFDMELSPEDLLAEIGISDGN